MSRVVTALLALIMLAGCGTSTVPGSVDTARTVTVGFGATGHTVKLHPGDTLTVRLDSTYWQFGTVRGRVLHQHEAVVHAVPIGKTVPGSGAGTVRVDFLAEHAGIATITAGRRSCGEAMRCSSAQGRFRLYVVVR